MKKQLFISFIILLFLLGLTAAIVLYGEGYRFSQTTGLSQTGLLVTTSVPDGAEVVVNGHLTTATNNTITLTPGDYDVKILKDGYFPWEKKISIQKEVVTKAEALLFPTAPKLESITDTGVWNPIIDPSLTKIAYTIASQSAKKNGVYILDMTSHPLLTLQSAASQVVDDTTDAFSHAQLSWSPDGKNLMATVASTLRTSTYLLDVTGNIPPKDISETLNATQDQWKKASDEKKQTILDSLPNTLGKIVSSDFNIVAWSPDETKILYTASQSAIIPMVIKPQLIGTDSTPEERTIQKAKLYVYDIKEDKNFQISTLPDNFDHGILWFPDSKHLVEVHEKKVEIMEYDGMNVTTVYAGPFVDSYLFPWPNGTGILILTNLSNGNTPPNLYTIVLK